MPLNNLPFVGEKDPMKKAQNVYKLLDDLKIDANFIKDDGSTRKDLTRAYIEMVIEDFAIMTQNQALFNKFLQIDTKLEKALREYQAELKGLFNSILGTSMMAPPTTVMQQPVPMQTEPQNDMQVEKSKSVGIE
jgi:hypothetical protein